MRIIFAGTPEFAAKALEALIQSEHEVVMVLSQPDRPAGRGRKLKESAVKALAKQHHIPVYTPLTLRVEKGGEETAEGRSASKVVDAEGCKYSRQSPSAMARGGTDCASH